jgi:hypothetical protein
MQWQGQIVAVTIANNISATGRRHHHLPYRRMDTMVKVHPLLAVGVRKLEGLFLVIRIQFIRVLANTKTPTP